MNEFFSVPENKNCNMYLNVDYSIVVGLIKKNNINTHHRLYFCNIYQIIQYFAVKESMRFILFFLLTEYILQVQNLQCDLT